MKARTVVCESACTCDQLTANGCESYHAHLNADFYYAQPNIYLLVETLLRQQSST